MDNRKHKRVTTDIHKINSKMMLADKVEVIDISKRGLSLKIDRALKINTEYMLWIRTDNRSISVKGAVVWSELKDALKTEEGDVVPLYSAGMQFNDLESEKIYDLLNIIGPAD